MASVDMQDRVERFDEFFRTYYADRIAELAQHYPAEQRSLFIEWTDLYRFDEDLAADMRTHPEQLLTEAEEALRVFDLPVDISLERAHVRVRDLPETTGIRDIRADDVNDLVAVRGIVRKATGVNPRIEDAVFECQRCGTLTSITQVGGTFQEPHECPGCERKGPFRLDETESTFIDSQTLRVQESPEGLRGGQTPESIDIHIEDDIAGQVSPGDHVRATGILRLDQQTSGGEESTVFDVFMEGSSVEAEEEQFEEMEITDEDREWIIEQSERDDIYEQMVNSIAPSIYGYENAKLAMTLQLFSGVTKELPDGSRTRGDMHLLLIGDPGTGKCLLSDTNIHLSDGSTRPIGAIVEEKLEDPTPVDDGVYEETSFLVPSVGDDGTVEHREVTRVWKRESPEKLLRITTQRGREITMTPSHPLFVHDNGNLVARTGAELEEAMFLAVPTEVAPISDDYIDVSYHKSVGFVTDRKVEQAEKHDETPRNTNHDVIPEVSELLKEIRTSLCLSQCDCGVPHTTYQHYERGDRNPSRESLRKVVTAFEERIVELNEFVDRLYEEGWSAVPDIRRDLGVSQDAIASRCSVSQAGISYYERTGAIPDGGIEFAADELLAQEIHSALAVEPKVDRLRTLVESEIGWDQIESIERIEPEEDWVYDLEVEGTHNYIAEGIVSHNSQLLQYVRNIAPRSVYTSGKGSSAAGLCVTGDTLIHTCRGIRSIQEIAEPVHPTPVESESAEEYPLDLPTLNVDEGQLLEGTSSHIWRMPKKQCRRIETQRGKELEASRNTPILTCGEQGLTWKAISEIEPGDHVAVPHHDGGRRWTPQVQRYLELENEKVRLSDRSILLLREQLKIKFGTLREAASALNLSEDIIYDSLSNRYLALDRLETILDHTELDREDITIERTMLAHGYDIRIPQLFDEDLLYLIGLVFGDGNISLDRRGGNRGHIRISNSDVSLLKRAASIIEEKFDKSVEIEYQDARVPCIRLYNATIARLFRNIGMCTPKKELELDSSLTNAHHTAAFLRGLMDADGSVVERTTGGSSVQFSTISEKLAKQVQLMLETYGIHARKRTREPSKVTQLEDGTTIVGKNLRHELLIYGKDIDRYSEKIGFESHYKRAALDRIRSGVRRQDEIIPGGNALATAAQQTTSGHTQYLKGTRNPGRIKARKILSDIDFGPAHTSLETTVNADLVWDEVVAAVDTGEKEVFDLTVPDTHNFIGNGIVTHNTAAAVRDDFGDGTQWSLEAGALVLADQGVAAIDELDKMRCVTGDTLVRLDNDETRRIDELAEEARRSGTIEELPNGRTIRGEQFTIWTMDEDEGLVTRPVTAIHEYEAPRELIEVTLEDGSRIRTTPDHPFITRTGGARYDRPASNVCVGHRVYVPNEGGTPLTDGGIHRVPGDEIESIPIEESGHDVIWRAVTSVEVIHREDVGRGEGTHVYDLTVEGTHNYVANGMIVHNSEDRSALHEGLEAQEISISKAGINATLKARCSLLGAANPRYGRFDPYEPIGEQIDLEPALISRFDLIFTVTDQPDPDEDRELADHILETNYAGELTTRRSQLHAADVTDEEIEAVSGTVTPAIDPERFRKYVAFAQQSCFPRMTDEAREAIRDFYVDLRSKGSDQDAPVPVTARKLEALVRLAEASARIRLSDTVELHDAERVITLVRSCLQDIGVDPETGEYDADVIETGRSKTQRDRVRNIKGIIRDLQEEHEEGAPRERVLEEAEAAGIERPKAEHQIQKLRDQGEVYSPQGDFLRVV